MVVFGVFNIPYVGRLSSIIYAANEIFLFCLAVTPLLFDGCVPCALIMFRGNIRGDGGRKSAPAV